MIRTGNRLYSTFAAADKAAAAMLLVCLLASPSELPAQEVNVPIEAQGRLDRIDRPLALELGLWTAEYPGFEEARLFQAPDGTFVLEISSRRDGTLVRHRLPLTPAEADELRADLAARLATFARPVFTQGGRPALLGATALLGLGYYGWAVPVALDADDTRLAVAGYMLTAGTSFFLPWALTRRASVTPAMADLAIWGLTRGAAHGALLHGAVAGDFDGRPTLAVSVAGSIALGYVGYRWARDAGLTPGATHTVGVVSDLAALSMAGLAEVADATQRGGSIGTLAGAGLGAGAGRWLAARRQYSWGDAEVLRTSTLLGAYLPQAVVAAVTAENDEAHILTAIAGGAAGLVTGDRLVRDTHLAPGDAVLIDLGTVAGGLLGLGAAYLIDPEADSAELYLGSSGLGALLGFGVMYRALAPEARDRAARQPSAWRLHILPTLHRGDGDPGGRTVIKPTLLLQHRF